MWSINLTTKPVSWTSKHNISVIAITDPETNQTTKQTRRQDRLQYTAPLAIAQCTQWLQATQTLQTGCSKTDAKIISKRGQHLVAGERDCNNLITWRCSLTVSTTTDWWWSMHAISSYRGNRHTNTRCNRQWRLQLLHRSFASAVYLRMLHASRFSTHAIFNSCTNSCNDYIANGF